MGLFFALPGQPFVSLSFPPPEIGEVRSVVLELASFSQLSVWKCDVVPDPVFFFFFFGRSLSPLGDISPPGIL